MSTDRQTAVQVAGRAVSSLVTALLIVGVWAVPFWEPGVYLALAGFTGLLGSHLAVGIIGYRETMSRPWPQVSPLEDDEDDW